MRQSKKIVVSVQSVARNSINDRSEVRRAREVMAAAERRKEMRRMVRESKALNVAYMGYFDNN